MIEGGYTSVALREEQSCWDLIFPLGELTQLGARQEQFPTLSWTVGKALQG